MVWRSLRHPNVLRLLGVTMTGTQFVLVSGWMGKGNLDEFVKAHINADRFGLVCLSVFRSGSLPSPVIDDRMTTVAEGRH